MFSYFKPLIFGLDPETAHDLAIKSLKLNVIPEKLFKVENEEVLEISFINNKIKNPIGLAAGFDKSAEVFNSIFKLGFGFVEVGTITPKKQLGNPKPRIFRLEEDQALINRLGFNNDGLEVVTKRLEAGLYSKQGTLGVNIGPNYDSKSFEDDFCKSARQLIKFSLADYITINISSPNTENLRDFHDENKLESLIESINKLKKEFSSSLPIFLKISPDIKDSSVENISTIVINQKIDGIILTNTTNENRLSLKSYNKNQVGGLSGRPIRDLSNGIIKKFYKKLKGKVFIIGVGGVDSGQTAFDKIVSGANAIQLYTGMIYKGPGIVKEIKKDLIEILRKEKIKNISEAVGIKS
tara:strand:+ start:1408 stop:2466 length:1059 start_codon:yes stop_codon:yes gene_type:complete